MSSTNTIFLDNDSQIVNLDGIEMTVGDLKEAVIGNAYYQGKLRELLGGRGK